MRLEGLDQRRTQCLLRKPLRQHLANQHCPGCVVHIQVTLPIYGNTQSVAICKRRVGSGRGRDGTSIAIGAQRLLPRTATIAVVALSYRCSRREKCPDVT